jgi:hypothetical protein
VFNKAARFAGAGGNGMDGLKELKRKIQTRKAKKPP